MTLHIILQLSKSMTKKYRLTYAFDVLKFFTQLPKTSSSFVLYQCSFFDVLFMCSQDILFIYA